MAELGRVLSFFSSRQNWDSPNPSPAGERAPPPHLVLGGWERPNSDEGTYTVVLFIYTYFVELGYSIVVGFLCRVSLVHFLQCHAEQFGDL